MTKSEVEPVCNSLSETAEACMDIMEVTPEFLEEFIIGRDPAAFVSFEQRLYKLQRGSALTPLEVLKNKVSSVAKLGLATATSRPHLNSSESRFTVRRVEVPTFGPYQERRANRTTRLLGGIAAMHLLTEEWDKLSVLKKATAARKSVQVARTVVRYTIMHPQHIFVPSHNFMQFDDERQTAELLEETTYSQAAGIKRLRPLWQGWAGREYRAEAQTIIDRQNLLPVIDREEWLGQLRCDYLGLWRQEETEAFWQHIDEATRQVRERRLQTETSTNL